MNYLIWKNINSKDIKGLLISELPPITKPNMRVQETQIDGVDGSIIEELGYESYDKQILIGLTKDFDINEVIKYFSGEGNIVFSNEPDKYYKARIINQIDYERLLRFRTATVKFRVQPFKYEYQEEKTILSEQETTGTEIQIVDSKLTKINVEGKSIQNGTPAPETSVEIESVGDSGSFEINQIGKNLLDDTLLQNGYTIDGTTGKMVYDTSYVDTRFASEQYIKVYSGMKLVCNYPIINYGAYNDNKEFISRVLPGQQKTTISHNGYIRICVKAEDTNLSGKVQLEEGTVVTEYEHYKGNNYVIPLSEPLRSLPNGTKDIAYIKNNKLYVDRNIGSLVLNGTEGWVYSRKDESKNTFLYQMDCKNKLDNKNINVISSHFVGYNADDLWQKDIVGISLNSSGNLQISCNFKTSTELKNWLSNNNVDIVYKLEKSYTEIEGELSVSELFTNNITVVNSENANMIVSYIDDKVIVNNLGNYEAKPVIAIKGAGTIELIVNDNKLFRYTFPDGEDTVVIDSQKQDAYVGAVLKNRSMSGEFPIFEIGENTITWEGIISGIEISSKSRWL